MNLPFETDLQPLCEDGERVVCRIWRVRDGGERTAALAVCLRAERPSSAALKQLAHELDLKGDLDPAWAAQPLELIQENGRTMLLLDDPGGEPLQRLVGAPMETGRFLRLAADIAAALGKAHRQGLVHKDIKPANILVECADGRVRLTGFGVASRLVRERQAPGPPEIIAGTLAYMAPEQTGRMNRSVDSRSDLYALGVTLYRMLTGVLPFSATDPMEWIHCHIARKAAAPAARLGNVPATISDIVMKLLAKTPEERYQTAAGLERDLRRCLADWQAQGRIGEFALGERDVPDGLLIPEKLYARSRDVEALLAAYDRVAKTGAPELVLVSGYSGVGKSSVVNELHKALVPLRGLFAAGKFDQYKLNIPYATVAQALQGLVRQILGKSDAELAKWREAFVEALGPNGQLMINLAPELALIVGEQPPPPEVPPQDQQARFQLVFWRFLGAFARAEHPLALFLDDLQWLDAATLDLIERLISGADARFLLLVGAYRDNEVALDHPLARTLGRIRAAGGSLTEIKLEPLRPADVERLVADALHAEPESVWPLAELVFEKTAGNPFFAIQFLLALTEEGLLAFDSAKSEWTWELSGISAKNFTDNVADLMATKLGRLPPVTQAALQALACLGNHVETGTLAAAQGWDEEATHTALSEAVHAGLVARSEHGYAFLHDRIEEAAYALIPEDERAIAHLRIGRLLMARTAPEELGENVFEIVNQFARSEALIAAEEERERVAELNLAAGKRAKAASAYDSALKYFAAGRALLGEDGWKRRYRLAFDLEIDRAECEYLIGDLPSAESRLAALSDHAQSTVDSAAVVCLRMNLLTTQDQRDQSVAIGLDCLRSLGLSLPPHPASAETNEEYERMWRLLGDRAIGSLIDLPLMNDPDGEAKMDVLATLLPPALFTDEHLFRLIVAHMATVSLAEGHTHGSCLAYVWLGVTLGSHFNRHQEGLEFGRLGVDLMEKRGLNRFRARVYLDYSHVVVPWIVHARDGPMLVRRALDAANDIGDLTFAAYGACNLISALLAAGDPLADVHREAQRQLEFARRARYGLIADILTGQLALVLALRGVKPSLSQSGDGRFDEGRFERQLDEHPGGAVALAWYWVRKLQRLFFAGDPRGALIAAARVEPLLWTIPSHFEIAEYHLYAALACAASWDVAPVERRQALRRALGNHLLQLQAWSENCPENFENRAALVGAEIARIEGRDRDAMDLYELAMRSARANGFIHNEAIASELAASYYAARGFDDIANIYFLRARYCYGRWGADAKMRRLEEVYPRLRTEEARPSQTSTFEAPVEQLDLATVIKVSQAVSSQIVVEKLIDTLMRTAVAQAGAERGLLALAHGVDLRIAAEATTNGDTVIVNAREKAVTEAALPQTVLQYVQRTRDSLILDDAAAGSPFADDPHIRERHARSVLCLPLVNQAKLVGVLYLENNLSPAVFQPARIAVLKLLASQAAIAIENTRLYRELSDREAKIRRLVDANIIGIFSFRLASEGPDADDPVVFDGNDAFLRMLGYTREDLTSGGLRRSDLTPAEWHERDLRTTLELRQSGISLPFEKEYFRKDGSRAPVLVGFTCFDETRTQGLGFVLDLTERKRAEEALRRSEAYLAEAESLSKTGSWAWNAATREVTYWSQGRYRLFGFDPAAGVPTLEAIVERIHPEDRSHWLERTMTVARGEEAASDFRVVLPDGEVRSLHAVGHSILGQSGDVVEIIGAAIDVTERKLAEDALRESEEQWKAVFENNPTMYFMVDAAYTILSVNPFGAEQLGYTPDELIGRSPGILIHPGDRESALKGKATCLEHLGRTFSWELRKIRKDGEALWVRETGRAMLIRGRPVVLVVSEDITEAKRAAEALREMQAELAHTNRLEALGQLTASIAHEVNQPIGGTLTNAQAALRWLDRPAPDLDEAKQALRRIVRDATRAGAVVQRIRNLLRKTSARDDRVDISAVAHEVIEFSRAEAVKCGVSVQTELAGALPLVRGDRVELQQVLLNLVINAIEAMTGMTEGAPRKLLISASATESGEVLVSVRDTGPGLSPAVQENLFKAFYTTKPAGLGLGLSICRSIIEAHGGRLWASANSPCGAAFQFTVPGHPNIASRQ